LRDAGSTFGFLLIVFSNAGDALRDWMRSEVYKGLNLPSYAVCSSTEGISMRNRSEQHTVMDEYKGYDIAVRITGPIDKDAGKCFTVTISIIKNGEEVFPTFKESDTSHKTDDDALQAGITIARQEIDRLD